MVEVPRAARTVMVTNMRNFVSIMCLLYIALSFEARANPYGAFVKLFERIVSSANDLSLIHI